MLLICVADLRVTKEQIIRTEYTSDRSAIVQVRIGDQIYTRKLEGESFEAFVHSMVLITSNVDPDE